MPSAKVQIPPYLLNIVQQYSANKVKIKRGFWALVVILITWRIKAGSSKSSKKDKQGTTTVEDVPTKKGKKGSKRVVGDVDGVFVARFRRIFKIIVPGVASKEFMLLTLFSAFLVSLCYD